MASKCTSRVTNLIEDFGKFTDKAAHITKSFRVSSPHLSTKGNSPYKLVIFDKDGTLVCFHSMWAPWCENIACKLKQHLGCDVAHDVYNVFNYDPSTRRIGKGSLAEKTQAHVQAEVVHKLNIKHSFCHKQTEEAVRVSWSSTNTCSSTVHPVCDVKALFSELKASRIKIAVCTSDDRESTMTALEAMGVTSMVDFILCGNDPLNVPKPAPDNVKLICSRLGVHPRNAVMIGDTPADTIMGRSGGVGLVLGVLSGVGDEEDLSPDADFVIDNIEKALPFILSSSSHRQSALG